MKKLIAIALLMTACGHKSNNASPAPVDDPNAPKTEASGYVCSFSHTEEVKLCFWGPCQTMEMNHYDCVNGDGEVCDAVTVGDDPTVTGTSCKKPLPSID